MSGGFGLLVWMIAGATIGGLHLLLLRRSVERARALAPQKARGVILRGLPIRLLVWVPLLVVAARSGAMACGALLAGSWLARLAAMRVECIPGRVGPASGD